MLMQKACAFLKRDYTIDTSYRFAFFFDLLTSIVPLFSFYFISRLVDSNGNAAFSRYGVGYFPFVLVGLAVSQYFSLALSAFADTIRRSQMVGCLEAMLSTRTDPRHVILLSSLYTFGMKLVQIVLLFLVAGWAFGVRFPHANLPAVILALLLTLAAFCGFGILSAATLVVFKRGDPLGWAIGAVSSLLGGAVFPISILPSWLQGVSMLVPVTHALDAIRLAVFRGATIPMLWQPLAVLAGMACLVLPLGLWLFGCAVERGRRDGTLLHY